MPWIESDWEPVTSIRETYDNLFQFHIENGGKIEKFVPWELFREDMRKITKGEIPDDYHEYEVRVTKDGTITESFNGKDNIVHMPYRRSWDK